MDEKAPTTCRDRPTSRNGPLRLLRQNYASPVEKHTGDFPSEQAAGCAPLSVPTFSPLSTGENKPCLIVKNENGTQVCSYSWYLFVL